MRKKILSIALAAFLAISSAPLCTNAAELPDNTAIETTVDAENEVTTESATPADADMELAEGSEVVADAGTVAINEANFPDDNFRKFVKENLDTDKNNSLSQSEIQAVTMLVVYELNIHSLKGIEFFPNIWRLDCAENQLTSLDISKNTALDELWCENNQLTSLDVSKNTGLEFISCGGNQISSLDISKNLSLEYLYCDYNELTSLDASRNSSLCTLTCNYNRLTSLDFNKNANLDRFEYASNQRTIHISSNRTFDLSTLPGVFDVSKTGNWNGGTVSGTTLTVNEGASKVTYDYDCGNGQTATFTLNVSNEVPPVNISYRTHVQSFGWQGYVSNGEVAGTSGMAKRLEGINIKVEGNENLGIQYTTHVQSYGWMPWSSNNEMSGTTGEAKRLEAIKIQLTGADKDLYDVYYRVHAQSYGWLGWAKNGAPAGTAGYAKRLEAIQIIVVEKGQSFDTKMGNIPSVRNEAYIAKPGTSASVVSGDVPYVLYQTHVQTYGWQAWKNNGDISGTTGEAKRLEGINIKLSNKPYDGGIVYTTHVQKYGWQGNVNDPSTWKKDGQMAGTSGEAKRLEAICIKLTGEMEKHYDVYYRVHAQSYGWLGWAKNGEPSGTAGYAKRLEGIQIVLVPKGSGAPADNYGGVNANRTEAYISK